MNDAKEIIANVQRRAASRARSGPVQSGAPDIGTDIAQLWAAIRRLQANEGGGGGGGVTPPFWLVEVDSENVKVTFGTVNGITPTDVNTNIDVSGAPGTWSIYLHATLGSDGVPTAVAVENDGGFGGVPTDDSGNAYILIGTVLVSGGAITAVNPSLAWSQTFVACGRNPEDPVGTPGTYYWELA